MSAIESVERELLRRTARDDYADALIDEAITLLAAEGDRTDYNTTCYSTFEALEAGALQYRLGGSDYWFTDVEGDYDYTAVDDATVQAGITEHGSESGFLMIDIEQIGEGEPAIDMYDPTARLLAIEALRAAIVPWKTQTSRECGFYRLIPDDDYWVHKLLKTYIDASDATKEAKYRAQVANWMHGNDLNYSALGQYMDFVIPQCYIPYGEQESDQVWKFSFTIQILEALRLAGDKPVYPIVWMMMLNEGVNVELTEAQYTDLLKYVTAFPGIAGTILWSGGDDPAGWTWTDVIEDLVNAEGEFAPPVP